MAKKIGVVRFMGTNCDRDVFAAVNSVGLEAHWLWYQDQFSYGNYEALIIPGGFSYGDYLRSGALAARAPVMTSVRENAQKGVPVLGICNGFQILCEANMLPGALVKNNHLRFNDGWVNLNLVRKKTSLGENLTSTSRLPIAHGDGRYYVEEDKLKKLFDDDNVWWTYEKNPNGSIESIAGVVNESGNVMGLMPHPERAVEKFMGGIDGRAFFEGLLS